MMKGVSIIVLPDIKPGQRITATDKDGAQLETIVPSNAKGGDEIPAGRVMLSGEQSAASNRRAECCRQEVSTAGRSYDDDDGNSFNYLGRLNSYCLFFFALSSFVMCLSLLQSVSWDYSGVDGDCYWEFECCEASCEAYCYSEVCTSVLRNSRPVEQDRLPEPELAEGFNQTSARYSSQGGDGDYDYWGLPIAVACGGFGSVLTMVASCITSLCRVGDYLIIYAVMLVLASILHVVASLCLAINFFTRSNETVYNHLSYPKYEELRDENILTYLLDDEYYGIFGRCVLLAFIFSLLRSFGLVPDITHKASAGSSEHGKRGNRSSLPC